MAAEEEGATITAYCRDAIMEKAAPAPVIPDVAGLPVWLLHALLFFARGKTRPVMPSESAGNAKQPNQERTARLLRSGSHERARRRLVGPASTGM